MAIRPAKREIVVGGTDVVHYSTPSNTTTHSTARRTQSFLLRNPRAIGQAHCDTVYVRK